ncbi:MAG: hypothetical protein NTY19_23170 [Planctomycetota bacterium]|nr:hypothetical protein [Planctomycetota bacterium]
MTTTSPATSLDIRRTLVDTLRLDLVGPDNGDAFAQELLPESPTKWYLTGYLVPTDAPMGQPKEPEQLLPHALHRPTSRFVRGSCITGHVTSSWQLGVDNQQKSPASKLDTGQTYKRDV